MFVRVSRIYYYLRTPNKHRKKKRKNLERISYLRGPTREKKCNYKLIASQFSYILHALLIIHHTYKVLVKSTIHALCHAFMNFFLNFLSEREREIDIQIYYFLMILRTSMLCIYKHISFLWKTWLQPCWCAICVPHVFTS